jgi:hypothetical protein
LVFLLVGNVMTVNDLESQILSLTFAEKMQILQVLLRDFANIWSGVDKMENVVEGDLEDTSAQGLLLPNDPAMEEFEMLADQLADEFLAYVEKPVPALSDYAVSRAGIYEEHP